MTRENLNLYEAFLATDNAWGAELVLCFGKQAGDVRYLPLGMGAPGTTLRRLFEAREAAREAWERLAFASAVTSPEFSKMHARQS